MIILGVMLKSRLLLFFRIFSSSGDSLRTVFCSLLEFVRGRSLILTMMSLFWMFFLLIGEI